MRQSSDSVLQASLPTLAIRRPTFPSIAILRQQTPSIHYPCTLLCIGSDSIGRSACSRFLSSDRFLPRRKVRSDVSRTCSVFLLASSTACCSSCTKISNGFLVSGSSTRSISSKAFAALVSPLRIPRRVSSLLAARRVLAKAHRSVLDRSRRGSIAMSPRAKGRDSAVHSPVNRAALGHDPLGDRGEIPVRSRTALLWEPGEGPSRTERNPGVKETEPILHGTRISLAVMGGCDKAWNDNHVMDALLHDLVRCQNIAEICPPNSTRYLECVLRVKDDLVADRVKKPSPQIRHTLPVLEKGEDGPVTE